MKLGDFINFDGNSFPVYPALLRTFGVKEAVFLCRIIWWQREPEQWIEQSAEVVTAETGLTYKEQRRVRQTLVEAGVLEEEYKRLEHKQRFRIVAAALEKPLETFGHPPSSQRAVREETQAPEGKIDEAPEGQLPNLPLVASTKDLKRQSKKQREVLTVAFPDGYETEDFKAAWNDWSEHRRAMKKPLTPQSEKLQMKQLAEWGYDLALATLKHSTANGWQGLYPPKDGARRSAPAPKRNYDHLKVPPAEEMEEATR